MVVQHNISAMNANRMLSVTTKQQAKATEKLSSGYRINRAADDAAGLSISEKMRSQIRGLDKASSNAQDGISMIQTAEGALNESHSILQRMRELSVQAANGTETDDDREAVQNEITQLQDELTRISETTQFNTMNLLDGSLGNKSASSQGTKLTGSNVATFQAASMTTANISALDLSALAGGIAAKDTFEIDGESFTIDWSKGEAKDFLAKYAANYDAANHNGVAMTEAQTKAFATDLQSLLNNAAAEAGVKGTVAVKYEADGQVKITSNNSKSDSSFGFVGTTATTVAADVTDQAKDTESLGAILAGKRLSNGASINDATMKFSNTVANGSNFTMTINGTEVKATMGAEAKEGAGLDTVATTLEGAIQAAVGQYNTAMGYAGADALTATDFTVTTNKDGSFSVNYAGDKDVTFSFGEYTDVNGTTTTASKLGLTNKQSAAATQSKGMKLQIGANEGQTMEFTIDDMSAAALGVDAKNVDLSDQDKAEESITTIDEAIKKVSAQRSELGAVQNRLEHTIANLDTAAENTQTAESSIRDTDMADTMVEYSKNNILAQTVVYFRVFYVVSILKQSCNCFPFSIRETGEKNNEKNIKKYLHYCRK